MKQKINICDIYLLVCMICMLNGVVFTGGSVFIVGMQALLITISAGYAIYANFKYELPVYFKGLNALLILFTIYGFVMIMSGDQLFVKVTGSEVSKSTYLKQIYLSLLPIYALYSFARKDQLTVPRMRFWSIVFLAVAVACYFSYKRLIFDFYSDDVVVNNGAYGFVGLLPALILFDKKRLMQYTYLAVCLVFIIIGMKRGAILVGTVGLLWFLFFSLITGDHRRKRLYLFLSIVVVIIGYYVVDYMMATSDFFNNRIGQTVSGYSSGRDYLFSYFYNHFIHEPDFLRQMFGNGASATLRIGENYAHNDWLEIAINQGVFGLIIYAAYWTCFYKTWRRSKKSTTAYIAIGMVMIIYFVLTFFSMSYDGMGRCAAMVFGYYLAQLPSKKSVSVCKRGI